ncbi:LmeA family phospholipid-binding protein [Vampirovibrio chlorellavorus]|uniref:LmeA family phospholipid-binding protein n=1 Tax=Vampirovibrio chlorellavorus TaxID=758823 RepID=UPI0026EB9691|nr:DUF2993 domain-containing protein [Vampirovibrio chlorellavorus]
MAVGFTEAKPMPYPAFKTANGFSRFAQGMIGFTPLSGWMANRVLRREIQKLVSGQLDTRLSLYSGSDLLGGKARGLRLNGKQILIDGWIPLQECQLETLEDAALFVSKDRRPILLKPLDLSLTATMAEADLNAMLNHNKAQKRLNPLTVLIPPFGKQTLTVLNPRVSFEGDRITLISLVSKQNQPADTALPVQVSGQLSAEKSRLNLRDLDLQISGFEPEELRELSQFIENYFSDIVNLNHIKVERHTVKVQIEQSEIVDGQLRLKARIHVEPQRKYLEKYVAAHGKQANSVKN